MIPDDEVKLLPVDRIRVVNPRVREKKKYERIVENIAAIGLKKPITVTRGAPGTDGAEMFDLVCGQGRLEAFIALGQREIPAMVRSYSKHDGLLASLITYPINGNQPNTTNPSTGVNPPNINVWPAPDQSNFYTYVYWRLRRLQDAGNGVDTQDIPFRLLPCLVAGLAYYMSMKIPEALPRLEMLKMSYEEQWALASSEDREKASLRLAPREMFY